MNVEALATCPLIHQMFQLTSASTFYKQAAPIAAAAKVQTISDAPSGPAVIPFTLPPLKLSYLALRQQLPNFRLTSEEERHYMRFNFEPEVANLGRRVRYNIDGVITMLHDDVVEFLQQRRKLILENGCSVDTERADEWNEKCIRHLEGNHGELKKRCGMERKACTCGKRVTAVQIACMDGNTIHCLVRVVPKGCVLDREIVQCLESARRVSNWALKKDLSDIASLAGVESVRCTGEELGNADAPGQGKGGEEAWLRAVLNTEYPPMLGNPGVFYRGFATWTQMKTAHMFYAILDVVGAELVRRFRYGLNMDALGEFLGTIFLST